VTTPTEPTELSTSLIAGLAIQANQLTEAAGHLRDSVRWSRTQKVLSVIGLLMLIGLVVIGWQNRENGTVSRAGVAAIKDCTTPGGTCYRESRQATSDAITQIVSAVNAHTDLVLIATLECSRPHQSNLALARCLHTKGIGDAS
jgi:hypothetical protein